jgi:elongation factor P
MAKTGVNEIKKGNVILINDALHKVINFYTTQPGKGGAFAQIKLQNLSTGAIFEKRFRTAESVERAHLDSRKVQYLYNDGADFHFMDNETYEQFQISDELIGDDKNYLKENMEVMITFYNGSALSVELPPSIVLEVTYTEPAVKGNTASGNPQKNATLETGMELLVPMFINIGDMLKIDTRSGQYLERSKKD